MKKDFIKAFFLLSCGTKLCLAQSKCASIVDGEISGQTYTNKELGLSYTFPDSLKRDTSATLPKSKDGRMLLVLWKNPPDIEKPSVAILADDPSVYVDHSAIGYLHRIESAAKRYQPPAKILASGREYDFSGIKFYRVEYQFPEPSSVYTTAITGQVASCEITLQFVARTQNEIDSLAQSIRAIRFVSQKP